MIREFLFLVNLHRVRSCSQCWRSKVIVDAAKYLQNRVCQTHLSQKSKPIHTTAFIANINVVVILKNKTDGQGMLCYIDHIPRVKLMSIGNSGRIVIEVETGIKRELYSALSREGMTLKEWFLKSANSYISDRTQISLPLLSNPVDKSEQAMSGEAENDL